MQNIDATVKGDVLTIKIDLKAATTLSASGKSAVIATTRGNTHIEGTDVTLGLNLYRKV